MSVAHTPGPWTTNCPYGGTIYIDARISSKSMQEVASCGPTEEPDQQQANASLIAAAPDLLELAQLVYNSFSGGLVMTFSDADVEAFGSAISKATGGKS